LWGTWTGSSSSSSSSTTATSRVRSGSSSSGSCTLCHDGSYPKNPQRGVGTCVRCWCKTSFERSDINQSLNRHLLPIRIYSIHIFIYSGIVPYLFVHWNLWKLILRVEPRTKN
jgi:hypothetical protein